MSTAIVVIKSLCVTFIATDNTSPAVFESAILPWAAVVLVVIGLFCAAPLATVPNKVKVVEVFLDKLPIVQIPEVDE